ncbi:DNA replication licensing factor mcm8 [Kickxella alabastrina]|uniref:DNA replication licensing factor mcm8 n=1 Tax=Kickxella alabastrina TaxID=61397 RepID=A0ACC1IJ56_9FUNG|nr:DNA replication licensing factor mcm8 [Kickxella alabastrina]
MNSRQQTTLAGTNRLDSPSTGSEFSQASIGRYWPIYFPRHDFSSVTVECLQDIRSLAAYLKRYTESFSMETTHSCQFNYDRLTQPGPMADFVQRLRDEPEHLLNCLGLAVCLVLNKEYGSEAEYLVGDRRLHIRLLHHKPQTNMKHLKSSLVGKLVTVRGTVVRTSTIKPLLVQADFICSKCGRSQLMKIVEGKFETPTRCPTQGCKNRVFEVDRRVGSDTKTIDWQQIRIQEKINDDPKDPGRVPRSIDAELLSDMVDSVVPGDVVNCTGIVKVTQSDEGKGKGRANSLYILYLDAVAINKVGGGDDGSNKSSSYMNGLSQDKDTDNDENEMTTKDGIHFSSKDLLFIRKVYHEPRLFRLLVHSFCPGIFGHEMVKAGIMLALFGARKRQSTERGSMNIRSDSHVLVVGDPGLGKSQMLTAVGQIAPRGVYVCGTSGISSSGLTVTLVKESGSGDFALEAGALVLSDMGCCAIDEFDKVSSEHSSLLEAMEQQSISIAKGGLVCSLPARTSVIAAANPAGGHYNKAKTVAENLKINSALLSRFDLIFILLDRPDADMDKFLSEHVMAIHSGSKTGTNSEYGSSAHDAEIGAHSSDDAAAAAGATLKEQLLVRPGEKIDPLPPALLRKYVAYARKYVQPRLSPPATQKLKEFYLELRKSHRAIDSTPITTRQLEALVRLAEARARAELREIVTEGDAENVIEIMRHSLFQTYEDEDGTMDFSRSQMGTGVSSAGELKRFVAKLQRISEETYNNMFTFSMMHSIATEMGLHFSNFNDVVDKLNNQSFLIKKAHKTYQLTTF